MKIFTVRRRHGVSELVGTVLTTAITIMAGFAVFGYVNGQAGISERAYGQSAQTAVQALQENFVPFNMVFTTTSPYTVSVWFYNTGATVFYPIQISIYNGPKSLNLLYSATQVVNLNTGCTLSSSGLLSKPLYDPTTSSQPSNVYSLAQGAISYITLTLPSSCGSFSFSSGTIYFTLTTGLYGNSVVFSQSA